MLDLFESVEFATKIFVDRGILRHDFIPATLPHRHEHISRIAAILSPALLGSKVSNIFAYGKTGTGKTIVTRYVLDRLEEKAKQFRTGLTIAYVNCRLTGTSYRVLAALCKAVDVKVPFTGLAIGELVDRLGAGISAKGSPMIVAVDEIDAVVARKEEPNLLYDLTRLNERLGSNWIGIVGISNDLRFKDLLDPRVLSCLGEEEVTFPPYTADELFDILSDRAKFAFRPGVLDESSLRLCAALAAREHGDARRALDLLRVAGEIAVRDSASRVAEVHVRSAQDKIESDRVVEVIQSLPLHSKLVLVGVYKAETGSLTNGTSGDVYEMYKELCNQAGISPLTSRRVGSLLNELDMLGILNAKVTSFGRYGRTRKIRLGVDSTLLVKILERDVIVGPVC